MTILSTVCTKLLCTNAHLGRRVAAHHFKVYIRGSRNGIAILDSDKTLICLRNALHFIGSLIRQNGRSFFLKTNHFFIYLIMEKMIYSIMEKMGSCINDSQWKIGAFLTNSYANPKKFRSRKKKIHFGLNQQPDCVVIPNPDRKSSVILEANRSQIPIASLVDSTIPWESNKRITYPIPANDTIQFIYLFRHSITKTVILERPRITASEAGTRSGGRRYLASASDPKGGNRFKNTFFLFYLKCKILLSWVVGYLGKRRKITILFVFSVAVVGLFLWLFPGVTELFLELLKELFPKLLKDLLNVVMTWVLFLLQSLFEGFQEARRATLGGMDKESPSCSEGETALKEEEPTVLHMEDEDWNALSPIQEIPPFHSPERGEVAPNNPVPAAPAAPAAPPAPAAAPEQPLSAKDRIFFNLTQLHGSLSPEEAFFGSLSPEEFLDLTNEIYEKKESILEELRRLTGPVNGQILWQDDTSGNTIRNPQSGKEYDPSMLSMILDSLRQHGRNSKYYKKFLNDRIDTLKKNELINLELNDPSMEELDPLNQVKLLTN